MDAQSRERRRRSRKDPSELSPHALLKNTSSDREHYSRQTKTTYLYAFAEAWSYFLQLEFSLFRYKERSCPAAPQQDTNECYAFFSCAKARLFRGTPIECSYNSYAVVAMDCYTGLAYERGRLSHILYAGRRIRLWVMGKDAWITFEIGSSCCGVANSRTAATPTTTLSVVFQSITRSRIGGS